MGCSKDNDFTEELHLIVDHQYKETPSNIYPNKSLNVMIEGDKSGWFTLYNNAIVGFTYEEGYMYKLLVKRTHIKNPPQDGSSHKYELIKLIDKNKLTKN